MAASTMDEKNDDCGPLQSGAATATTPLQVQAKAALRKNKKLKSSSSSRLPDAFDPSSPSPFVRGVVSPPSSATIPGFRFFQAGVSPAVDFQIGSLSSFHRLSIPSYSSPPFAETPTGQFGYYPSPSSSFSPSAASAGLLFRSSAATMADQESTDGSMNIQSSLASSIESLSSLNQDLHWKLQQQRLAILLATSPSNQDLHQ
ncbi:hypothetical protein SAY86_027655 [Trapa natans]|uniref:Uncharacterized protein n=1 Tax=Trapa natans TaxID=22666 RepID=A0AAN7QMJ5_TRANT|nr:hypothetical protein SAY86_027655 [Trapa natans]